MGNVTQREAEIPQEPQATDGQVPGQSTRRSCWKCHPPPGGSRPRPAWAAVPKPKPPTSSAPLSTGMSLGGSLGDPEPGSGCRGCQGPTGKAALERHPEPQSTLSPARGSELGCPGSPYQTSLGRWHRGQALQRAAARCEPPAPPPSGPALILGLCGWAASRAGGQPGRAADRGQTPSGSC